MSLLNIVGASVDVMTIISELTAEISLDTGCESFIRRDATEEEILECRHVADQLNMPIWVALVVGAAERFAFYAITTPWREQLDLWKRGLT